MKKSNIILIVLSVLILCVCIFIVMTYKGSEGSTTTLLKDMGSDELRVVENKTDVDGKQEGSFIMKGEKPEGYMEPEDLDKQVSENKNNQGNNGVSGGNTAGQNNQGSTSDDRLVIIREDSVFVGNPNKGELKEYAPGEYSNVIEEVVVPEKVVEKKTRITYEEAMAVLRSSMNSESQFVSSAFTLTGYSDINFKTLLELKNEKGLVIIPFSVKNEKQLENVKAWVSLYEKHSSEISFLFLNTDIEFQGFSNLESVLEKYGIPDDLPIYASEFGEINSYIAIDGVISNQGYIILDRGFYVLDSGTLSDKIPNLTSLYSSFAERDAEYKRLEDLVTEKYNQGWIIKYSDVQKAIDGTLTAPETENEIETDIDNIETE